MTRDILNKAKSLEDRIFQLRLFSRYIETVMAHRPFHVELKTSILGSDHRLIIPYLNDLVYKGEFHEDDKRRILNEIEKIITKLEDELINL